MGLERDEEIYTDKNAKQHLTTEQQKHMEYKYPQQRTQSEQQIVKPARAQRHRKLTQYTFKQLLSWNLGES